jgi:hypothetical protein
MRPIVLGALIAAVLSILAMPTGTGADGGGEILAAFKGKIQFKYRGKAYAVSVRDGVLSKGGTLVLKSEIEAGAIRTDLQIALRGVGGPGKFGNDNIGHVELRLNDERRERPRGSPEGANRSEKPRGRHGGVAGGMGLDLRSAAQPVLRRPQALWPLGDRRHHDLHEHD